MRLALVAAMAIAVTGCNGSDSDSERDDSVETPVVIDKPAKPEGMGSEFTVALPEVFYPLPAVQYADNNADGVARWSVNENPIAFLLRDINQVWRGTSEQYQQSASGDGPSEYLDDPIIDAAVWQANIGYVMDVTNKRTEDQAILAFLDDVRSKNYSVIDGYGPLTETYVANSGAYTDVPVPTTNQVLQDPNFLPGNNDGILWAGQKTSELGAVVNLVDAFRQRSPASTNASKYLFSTPRPWRMNSTGAIEYLGTNKSYSCVEVDGTVNNHVVDEYVTSVSVIPGLMCARRPHSEGDHTKGLYTPDTENRRKDGGYPSGHTNAGYLAAMAYAYALPQRYAEMLTRASLLGENRIMTGMHSPVDVIGGRIHSMIIASSALNRPDILDEATAAYDNAQTFFGRLAANEEMDLFEYAHRPVENERGLIDGSYVNTEVYNTSQYDDHELNKELYRFRMTYNLPQDPAKAGQDPIVPEGAESLLASRQPYLSAEQRRAVLYTTSIDSGYPLLDGTNGWGRLDLVTAADGYAAFLGDVTVDMDASKGGFHVQDWWRNDISGEGRLTKMGTGHLTLEGDNTFSGGTLVQAGVLEAKSATAFGDGDLYIEDGDVTVSAEGALEVQGSLTMDAGTLTLHMDEDATQVSVDQTAYIDGGSLKLDFSDRTPVSGEEYILLSGGRVAGSFASVDAGDVAVEVLYGDSDIKAVIQ